MIPEMLLLYSLKEFKVAASLCTLHSLPGHKQARKTLLIITSSSGTTEKKTKRKAEMDSQNKIIAFKPLLAYPKNF